MARDMNVNQTEFYRALVEHLQDGEWVTWSAYGPYHTKGQAQDRDARWSYAREKYENGTRRVRRQKQVVNGWDDVIEWHDVD